MMGSSTPRAKVPAPINAIPAVPSDRVRWSARGAGRGARSSVRHDPWGTRKITPRGAPASGSLTFDDRVGFVDFVDGEAVGRHGGLTSTRPSDTRSRKGFEVSVLGPANVGEGIVDPSLLVDRVIAPRPIAGGHPQL